MIVLFYFGPFDLYFSHPLDRFIRFD